MSGLLILSLMSERWDSWDGWSNGKSFTQAVRVIDTDNMASTFNKQRVCVLKEFLLEFVKE